MICPKCGQQNDESAHECVSCGIYFIRWMIQQHRRIRTRAGPRGPAPLFRFPREFSRGAVAAVFLVGIGAGFTAGRLMPAPPPTMWGSYAPVTIPFSAADKGVAGLLAEARANAPQGLQLPATLLHGYFSQGANSFTAENLRLAAQDAGNAPQVVRILEDEYYKHKKTPFKCLVDGHWAFFASAPGADAGAQECWALGRVSMMDGDFLIKPTAWEALQWAPGKARWALFTRDEDKELFRRYIETRLGPDAEAADIEEGKEIVKNGSDKARQASAALTPYRTRARRAGALYRLRKLGK